jgi:hypothetical protein
MRVCIHHNVARDEHGHMINFDGYEPGHPLVLVFKADVTRGDEVPVSALAEQFWAACNLDPDMLTGRMAANAEAYRERRLRSLSVGDVVVCGEGDNQVAMRVDRAGFSTVPADRLNIVVTSEHGTQPWPADTPPIKV